MLQSVLIPATATTVDRAPDPIEYRTNIKRLRDEFFRGEWNWITRPNHDKSAWVTCSKFPLSTGGFVNKFADPLNLLGISFGDITNYLAQDIDIGSPYHPANDPQEFERFLGTLDKIGLTAPVIIQSSYGGGIHIYYFLARSVSTIRVATLIQVTSIDAGFHIKDGDLELFPNVKKYTDKGEKPSYFKALRSPLQPNSGAMILDRDGNPLLSESDFSYETQLQKFLELAIESAATNDIDLIEKKLDPAYKKYTKKIDKYQQLSGSKNLTPRALEWKENLETEFEIGWTGNGQTNDLLRKFVEYVMVFEQLTDRDEICKRVLERVLSTRGYPHCRHQLTIVDRIADWVDCNIKNTHWVPYCGLPPRRGGEYPSGSKPPTSTSGTGVNQHNVDTAARAFERFLDVIDLLSDIPSRIVDLHKQIAQKMCEIFGVKISLTTLYKVKYKAIWMKLIGSKKTIDLLPMPDDLGEGVCNNSKTYTETELEVVNSQLEDNTLKSLEPTIGETFTTLNHYGKCSTGSEGCRGELVDTEGNTAGNLDPQLIKNKNSLPDLPQSISTSQPDVSVILDLPQSIEPQPDNLSISDNKPGASVIPALPDPDTNPQPDLIGTLGEPYTSLIVTDRVQLIDSPDPAHSIGVLYRIAGSIATVVWKATMQDTEHLVSDLRAVDCTDPTNDLDRYSESLKRRQRRSIEQNRLILHQGCSVRPVDPYHVHGADIGIVTAIESWGVYVNWSDRSSGRYAVDELVKIEPAPT